MNLRVKKILTRTLIAFLFLFVILVCVFFYLFPWALNNEAIEQVEGPPIPLLSLSDYSAENLGAAAYERSCLYCHDTGIAPSLRQRSLPAALVMHFGRNGGVAMPPFRATEISDEELKAIAEMVEGNRIPELAK